MTLKITKKGNVKLDGVKYQWVRDDDPHCFDCGLYRLPCEGCCTPVSDAKGHQVIFIKQESTHATNT